MELWFAVSLLEAILVPFNTALKGLLLEYQIKDSEISILFVDSRLNDSLPRLHSSNIKKLIWQKKQHIAGPKDSWCGIETMVFDELLAFPEYRPSNSRVDMLDSPLMMLYTSGTTGDPKGVSLSHRAYLNRTREISDLFRAESGDIFLNALPLFHTSGQVMTTLPANFEFWDGGHG